MSVDINEIIDNAFDLEGVDRDAYLNVACAGDTRLRANVDQLLQGLDHSAPTEFMEGPIPLPNVDLIDDLEGFMDFPAINSSHIKPGQHIDAYKVVDRLGKGGMGEVYLAERDDGEFKQRVAVKVVRSGMATDEVYKRFQYERQILANLSHPHIARLLFGGVTTDGLPYFVMEYVEDGVPLTEYCDTHELSIKERLELFKKVCDAVRYAQRNLVIHRDLKPSNILVNKDGVVKLLDFGIAKLLDSEMDPVTMFETTQHKAPFTPAYGAPEQVRGKGISAATDVYSLGMILYELLTGRRPYELEPGWLKPTNVELICEFIPSAPSSIVTRRFISEETGVQNTLSALRQSDPIRLKRTLHGDLDAIVMKALKKEPENRYGAVGELYEEIERYLENRPVLAQNDTFRYRTYKFVQRKRSLVLVSTLGVLALVGGLVTALLYANFATEEAARARQEATRANATKEVLSDIFRSVDPDIREGDEVTLNDLFNVGREKMALLEDQPLVKADILEVMAEAYLNLSDFENAKQLYAEVLSLYKQELVDGDPKLATSLFGLGMVERNNTDYEKADSFFVEALELIHNSSADTRLLRSRILSERALLLNELERYAQAETEANNALSLATSLLDSGIDEDEIRKQQAIAQDRLATALRELGKDEQAEKLYREALTIRKEILGLNNPKVADTMFELANHLRYSGKPNEAEEMYLSALDIYQRVYEPDHPGIANSYIGLGLLKLNYSEEYGEAENYFKKSSDLYAAKFGESHLWTQYIKMYVGAAQSQANNSNSSIRLLRRSLQTFINEGIPHDHAYMVAVRYWLGKTLLDINELQEAEQNLLLCYKSSQDNESPTILKLHALAKQALTKLYTNLGDEELASKYSS